MTVDIFTLADRPDLADALWGLTDLWPPFMLEDPLADLYFSRLDRYARHVLIGVDDGEVLARAFAVPFAMGEDLGRPALPSSGWDGVIRWAWLDDLVDRRATHLSVLEITIAPRHRGADLAHRLIATMKQTARDIGAARLVAPVRPSRKQDEPRTPMVEYAARIREDGLPADPWLRLHVRAGARIHGVCPCSMTIPGSLADWRAWSGLPFDRSGPVEVAGALVPVHVDVAQDHAVYVEPNVWVLHDL